MGESVKLLVLFIAVLLAAVCVFAIFSDKSLPQTLADALHGETEEAPNGTGENNNGEEIRAVWVTYTEIRDMVSGKSKAEFETRVEAVLEKLGELRINTLFWHTRAFCDALYLKTEFTVSKYICGADGAPPQYDPLEVVIEKAKEKGIAVYAWVNPFRVSADGTVPATGKAADLFSSADNFFRTESGVWLDPASAAVQRLVLDGIAELCDNYRIAGIQFDDYFYPSGTAQTVCGAYSEYKAGGGTLPVRQWRTGALSAFISSVYSFIKSKNADLVFSISPGGIPEKDLAESLADVAEWCSGGYADMLVPQIYYGLENETAPFEKTAEEWARMCAGSDVELVCGLAAYKCGKVDEFAGSGKNEWAENTSVLKDEYSIIAKNGAFSGFSLFSLSSCTDENGSEISDTEIKMLKSVIQ